jgi:hypothetical protein
MKVRTATATPNRKGGNLFRMSINYEPALDFPRLVYLNRLGAGRPICRAAPQVGFLNVVASSSILSGRGRTLLRVHVPHHVYEAEGI